MISETLPFSCKIRQSNYSKKGNFIAFFLTIYFHNCNTYNLITHNLITYNLITYNLIIQTYVTTILSDRARGI